MVTGCPFPGLPGWKLHPEACFSLWSDKRLAGVYNALPGSLWDCRRPGLQMVVASSFSLFLSGVPRGLLGFTMPCQDPYGIVDVLGTKIIPTTQIQLFSQALHADGFSAVENDSYLNG